MLNHMDTHVQMAEYGSISKKWMVTVHVYLLKRSTLFKLCFKCFFFLFSRVKADMTSLNRIRSGNKECQGAKSSEPGGAHLEFG